MYQNLKNILSALTIAVGGMVFSAGLGSLSPSSPETASVVATTAHLAESPSAEATTPARRNGSLKRQLAMPFISFSPLLSRRGG